METRIQAVKVKKVFPVDTRLKASKNFLQESYQQRSYRTHFSPSDGRGRSIAQCIFNSIKATSLQETLAVVGSDGTVAITGIYNGAIRCLEELCERPLQ